MDSGEVWNLTSLLRWQDFWKKLGVNALVLSGGYVSRAPMYVMRGAMPIRTLTYYMPWNYVKVGVRLVGRLMIPSVPFEGYFLEDAPDNSGKP